MIRILNWMKKSEGNSCVIEVKESLLILKCEIRKMSKSGCWILNKGNFFL